MRFAPIIKEFPHMLHGGDYNPDQWMDPNIWDEDFRIAKLAGINTLTVGIFSWSSYEAEEGVYNFDWLDDIMGRIAAAGMKAVLATPTGARPAWMDQKYPEVRRVDETGHRYLHNGRHNHCLTSPVYREKVTQINTLLAKRYKDHPALGAWHISNEYSGQCFCELCQEKFREWLKAKYKTLDALNHAWWTSFWSHTYTDWSQIEAPSRTIGETSVHGLTLDWRRFTTQQFVDFCAMECAPLRAITPDVPCCTNLMSTCPDINYVELCRQLDFVSWDNYPQWTGVTDLDYPVALHAAFCHDLMRGIKQRPFLLMESSPSATNWRPYARLHRPGVHILQSVQAIAHGADSVQYFQFRKSRGSAEKLHAAVVDHVGHENTRVTQEVIKLGTQILPKLDGVVGTDTPAKIALVYDWENEWAITDAKGFNNENKKYLETVKDQYEALWRLGAQVDIIDETCDALADYTIVIAPMLYMLRNNFGEKLSAYVEKGGTLVTTYATGYADDTDLCFLGGFPGPLKEAVGIWAEEIDVLMDGMANKAFYKGEEYAITDYCELVHARGAQVLATYGADFYAGMPAVTQNTFGKGKAYHIAGRFEPAFYKRFYKELAVANGIEVYELPKGVSLQLRGDETEEFAFVLNFTAEPQTVALSGTDLLTGKEDNAVTLPPHGLAVLHNPGKG